MLARYKMLNTCTYANMVADITGILTGTITSTGSLSAGADVANCSFYGTYPTGTYTLNSGSTAYTYAKVHSAYPSTTHYIQLGFNGSTAMTTLKLASSASGDVLTNSYTYTISGNGLLPQNVQAVDIIVNNNCFFISCPYQNVQIGIFDIGKSGLSRLYTSNMLMLMQPFTQGDPMGVVPYTWNVTLATPAYGTNIYQGFNYLVPVRTPYNKAGNLAVMENPVFTVSNLSAYSTNVIYGLNKVVDTMYSNKTIYSDSSGQYRLAVNTDTLGYSILIG